MSKDNGEILIFVSWRLKETDNGVQVLESKVKGVRRHHCDVMHFHSNWLVRTK